MKKSKEKVKKELLNRHTLFLTAWILLGDTLIKTLIKNDKIQKKQNKTPKCKTQNSKLKTHN
jgi:hypothetical protein